MVSVLLLPFPALTGALAKTAAEEKSAVNTKAGGPAKVTAQTRPANATKAAQTPAKKAARPSGPPAAGWEMQQWHRMAGRVELVSNKYGGKFATTHYTLLKPEPGDMMYLLNPQTRRFVSYPVAAWRKKFNFYRKNPGRSKDEGFTDFSPWKHIKDEKIVGMKCGRYSRMRTNNLPPPNDKTYTEEWSFCQDVKVPAALIELYKKTLNLNYDVKLGFPMRVNEIREWSAKKAKKVDLSYDTLSYKKSFVPQQFFEIPGGYKQVKDEMSVLMDEGGDMMAGDSGTGGLSIDEALKERLK
ncbi:MAG: hypothetical protein IT342_24220 [Candidatus Melainabacteria bacterium]|nr:hypothetical protein [Candidatus Melainabacteria bacterium]